MERIVAQQAGLQMPLDFVKPSRVLGSPAECQSFISVPFELFLSVGFDVDEVMSRTKNLTEVPQECPGAWMECTKCGRWVVTPIVMIAASKVRPRENDWYSDTRAARASGALVMALPDPLTFSCDWDYCMDGDDSPEFQRYMAEFIRGLTDTENEKQAKANATAYDPLRKSSRTRVKVEEEDAMENEKGYSNPPTRRRHKVVSNQTELCYVMCFCCHRIRHCRRPFPGCSHWVCSLSPVQQSCQAEEETLRELHEEERGLEEVAQRDLIERMRIRMKKSGVPVEDPRVVVQHRLQEMTQMSDLTMEQQRKSGPDGRKESHQHVEISQTGEGEPQNRDQTSPATSRKRGRRSDERAAAVQDRARQDPSGGIGSKKGVAAQPIKKEVKDAEVHSDADAAKKRRGGRRKAAKLSWVGCDKCGKWRIVSETVLRNVTSNPEGRWECRFMKPSLGISCRTPCDASRFGEHGEDMPDGYVSDEAQH